MKTSDIRKMAQAYVQVLEGKQPEFEVPEGLDKEGVAHFMGKAAAAHKAGKKSFEMGGKSYPVTIKPGHPAGQKEEVEKVEEAEAKMKPCPHCEGSMENHNPDCPHMKQEGWDDMMKAVKDRAKGNPDKSPFDKKKISTGTVYTRKANKDGSSKVREDVDWKVFRRILEKKDAHTKGATPPEAIDAKASGSEKEFIAKHGGLDGNDSGIDGAKAAADTAKAATAGVRVAPKRTGDNSAGDKAMPTVSKVQGQ